ncbi:MAG TPA: sulfatase-like hydrolase/transferase, partial [Polyangiaceae bacterium]|nr:sulfatase-like hydrolase/transferase [Polyangiaceae bacterium]
MRLRAFGASLAGATFGCLIAAALDARFAVQRQPAPWLAAFAVSFGTLVPLALVFAGVGWATRILLLDSGPVPSSAGVESARVEHTPTQSARTEEQPHWLRGIALRLSPSEAAARRELAVVCAVAPWFAFLGLLALSRTALSALASSETASGSGVRLGLTTLVVLGTGWLWIEALARYGGARAWRAPSPLFCLVVSAAVMSIVFGLAVATGAPSGAGGAWQMLGVLNRDELDLRPVGLIGLIACSSVLWPEPAGERFAFPVSASSFGLWIGSLAFTFHAARGGFDQRSVALAIETAAPLAGKLVPSLRKRFDRDHDGYSAYFGGGDCDDGASAVNPLAEDVPGNGRDEDCSGSDASALAAPAPSAPTAPSGAPKLPDRLNVVLLTVDTLRYDLGYAGNPRKISPKLDELAAESVVFERAYSLASYTAKSLPPMLIGKYSGETHRGWSHFNRFEKADLFVAERLQRAGVRTVSVQGHWYFFQNFGMERGFDVIDSSAAPRALQAAEGDRSSTSEAVSNAVIGQLEKLA